MLTKQLVIAGAIALLPVMVQAKDKFPKRYHLPVIDLQVSPDRTATSGNWSGYVVKGKAGTVSEATASWVVPSVNCGNSQPDSYSSYWVGIDGAGSKSVEQTGTDSDCHGSKPSYYAWYEYYPKPSHGISKMTVQPGDHMFASVKFSGGAFHLTLTNQRTKQSFHNTSKVAGAKRISAEWIAEAPSGRTGPLPLSDFGTALFGNDHTGVGSTCEATIGSKTQSIGKYPAATAITMKQQGVTLAVPSKLSSDGSSFSVKWH